MAAESEEYYRNKVTKINETWQNRFRRQRPEEKDQKEHAWNLVDLIKESNESTKCMQDDLLAEICKRKSLRKPGRADFARRLPQDRSLLAKPGNRSRD